MAALLSLPPYLSPQQKIQELQKAQEKVCYLQEQLEEVEQQATPTSSEEITGQDSRIIEEMRAREREIQVCVCGSQYQS